MRLRAALSNRTGLLILVAGAVLWLGSFQVVLGPEAGAGGSSLILGVTLLLYAAAVAVAALRGLDGEISILDDPQIMGSVVDLFRDLTLLSLRVRRLAVSEETAAERELALALSESFRRLDTQVSALGAIHLEGLLRASARHPGRLKRRRSATRYLTDFGDSTDGPEPLEGTGAVDSRSPDQLRQDAGAIPERPIVDELRRRVKAGVPFARVEGGLRRGHFVQRPRRAHEADLREVAACIRRASKASEALVVLSAPTKKIGGVEHTLLSAADLLDVADALSEALDGIEAITRWLLPTAGPTAEVPAAPSAVATEHLAELFPDRDLAELPHGVRPGTRRYPDGLTAREVEVLRHLANGRTSREISTALVVALPTVSRHIANIYGKIDARCRADATRYAIAHGLVQARSSARCSDD